MPELQICLLGAFQVSWDFQPVSASSWRNPFSAKLLKLLLVRRPDPVSAEEAVRLLGGGIVRADLPAAVEHARRVLGQGAQVIMEEHGLLSFRPGPQCWIDVDALLAHYEAGRSAAARGDMFPAILAFQEADALYQGDLLEELQEPWLLEPRQRLQTLYTEILDRLAEGHAVLARYQDAVGFCHKALAHDPLREATYQRMMVYYYYLGDLSGAAEAFKACQFAMENAGRRMSQETADLWSRLSRGDVSGAPGGATAAAALLQEQRERKASQQ